MCTAVASFSPIQIESDEEDARLLLVLGREDHRNSWVVRVGGSFIVGPNETANVTKV